GSTTLDINNISRTQEGSTTFYNPDKEVHLFYGKRGKLPHMHQGSVWYFVTFRLDDALPKEKIEQLEKEREQWLKVHKKDKTELTEEEKQEYYKLFSERVEEWLNNGYGSCILKDEKIARIVADTLLHFNGERYDLDDWVIMPNHVHLLIRPRNDYTLSDILHSIKSYSAHRINKVLNRKESVWMHESYDHIVRNENSFLAIKNYIRSNPIKANVKLPDICCSWKIVNEELREDGVRSREDIDTLLRKLFDYSTDENPFDEETTLKLIDAIEKIKILDPACGSGAFPMGVLHKLVLALHKLDPENKIWKQRVLNRVPAEIRSETEQSLQNKSIDYIRKLGLIENCIYGVDIQEIAIQISKLRFFISLLVEQEIDDTKPNRDIRALPNLETKFVAANTLIELKRPKQFNAENTLTKIEQFEQSEQLKLISPEVEVLEKQLFNIREEIFYTNSRKEKLDLQRKEKELREKLKYELKKNGFSSDVAEKITNWDPFDQNTHAEWFDPEWMFGVRDGFDIVIGNPPYIQLQKSLSEKSNLKYADLYKDQDYKTFDRTGDIYCLFYEKGMNLLKINGYLCYITSNKWMRAGYGKKLRDYFSKFNPLILIDLGPGVFENATVDTSILLIQKAKNRNNLKALTLDKNDRNNISSALNEKGVYISRLNYNAWFIGNSAEQKLKEKIENIGKPLKYWNVKIYRGILTGLNEAFIITTEKRNEILKNCKDEEERKRTEAIIKPILRGRDIKRYYYEWAGLWVIIIPAGWTNMNKGKENAITFIEKIFPSLMKHLKPFEAKAKKRDDQGEYWWELRACAYYPEFEKEKVIYSEIVRNPQFYFDIDNFYVEATSFLMTGKNLKYICGLLNSNPITFFFKKWYAGGGLGEEGYRYKKAFIEDLPFPTITSNNQSIVEKIETLVDKIISAKKENPQSDTSAWEKEIDHLVYQLYELTPEEIEIIEGGD
ncbi:MAG: TaqI-like C-terminal specificity domain-containing protein, partial [Ignavibacteria bacterium]|nr:TaqI-like C-terminal specificity domain-containing protein [Ignavibacteria bacterium]